MREQCKSVNNWSADDVMQYNAGSLFSRFRSVARAMASKHQDSKIWLPGIKGRVSLFPPNSSLTL